MIENFAYRIFGPENTDLINGLKIEASRLGLSSAKAETPRAIPIVTNVSLIGAFNDASLERPHLPSVARRVNTNLGMLDQNEHEIPNEIFTDIKAHFVNTQVQHSGIPQLFLRFTSATRQLSRERDLILTIATGSELPEDKSDKISKAGVESGQGIRSKQSFFGFVLCYTQVIDTNKLQRFNEIIKEKDQKIKLGKLMISS